MSNDRNAGRKPIIEREQIELIIERNKRGESISSIAREYGVSRQALSKRIKSARQDRDIQMDYYVHDILCSRIIINPIRQVLRVINYTDRLSKRAFGYNSDPNWGDLEEFLDNYYMSNSGIYSYDEFLLRDDNTDIDILYDSGSDGDSNIVIQEADEIPHFHFAKKDRLLIRTDTDGYQMKAITHDRQHFVKSQAVISGVIMNDWAVEIIAYDLCRQLSISCVEQKHCKFVYEGCAFDGVYSDNFELDGYTFVSFERLLARNNYSTTDEEFISLDAMSKLKWCALRLSKIGDIPYEDTFKYMLDMAVIDCLIGNIDRHTKNFGLFFNNNTGRYEIPPIFDNGMGLFENDYYRDSYKSFEEAMNHVYVAPYGEDPFDMIKMLNDEFNLIHIYSNLGDVKYMELLNTDFSRRYIKEMIDYVRSKMD